MASTTDRDALMALYRSTDGANWKRRPNWDTDAHVSEWYGVKVNDQGLVVELSLAYNNLRGHIPAQLGDLGALEYLYLNNNKLDGPIPPELGNLRELEDLRLSYNQLSYNQLTGPIPKELGALSKLERLWLDENGLTGHIPPELGNLSALRELYLQSNQLSGPIPPELGALRELKALWLSRNQITGPIPPELGNLRELTVLWLSRNQLTGSMPKELGALSKLESLRLNNNQLTGTIPKELGDLSKLEDLRLDNNKFAGVVPKELAKLRNMRDLQVAGNLLESPRPPPSYGMDMRDWGGIPTEDDKLRVRGVGVKDPGMTQPLIVKWLESITDAWHVVVPVVDDATDILLLTATSDPASPLWWICLVALVLADIERLWLLFTLCSTMVLLPFLWCYDVMASNFLGRTAARLFALVNCRDRAPQNTFRGYLNDSFLWVLVGSRSRCSPLWRVVGMSLDATVDEADLAGVGFGAIDKWVALHPFSFLGSKIFGADFALKGEDTGVSRRARVMIRAVGETLVVDSLFLALSVVSGGWDGNLTGVAGISALFSVLELLTELQYYVAEAGAFLEPIGSSGAATSGRSEQSVISDPPLVSLDATV